MISVGGVVVIGEGGGGPSLSSATPQALGVAAAGSTGEASDAGHVHPLPAGLIPVAVAVDLSSATGWTALAGAGGATATIDTGDEQIELAVPAGLVLGERYALAYSDSYLDGAGMDVRLRLRAAMLNASANDYLQLLLIDTAGSAFLEARVDGNGLVTARASGGIATTGVTVASILGGQGWLRLRQWGGVCIVYAGVGTGGAEPTSWTTVGCVQLTASTLAALVRLRIGITRNAAGTGTASADVGDISYRQTVAL